MAGFHFGTGFWKRSGSSCPSYVPGLYTAEEIDQLVFVDGYIPVASAAEFDNVRGGTHIMGAGTCWEDTFTFSADRKFIQVSAIDFSGFGTWTTPIPCLSGFIYDGNELPISNLTGADGLLDGNADAVKNMRLTNVNISATTAIVGAIANQLFSLNEFVNNSGDGSVSGGFNLTNSSVGGLAGSISGNVFTISDCYFSGNVQAERNVIGGVFGFVEAFTSGALERCEHLSGTVVCNQVGTYGITGHVAGVCRGFDISDCHNTLDILGAVRTGGLFGDADTSVSNCTNSGNVTGLNGGTGGIIGFVAAGTVNIENCVNTGNINCTVGFIGGIIGKFRGSINKCVNSGSITSASTSLTEHAGGIVGEGSTGSNSSTISECYVHSCTISGSGRVGGVIGITFGTDINNCFVSNTVTVQNGAQWTAGLCGATGGSSSNNTIQNCYSAASIPTGAGIRGLTGGDFSGTVTVTNCYWDTTVGPATSTQGTGQTTTQLQTPTTNSGIYAAWTIPPWDFGTASEYPTLTTTP